MPERPAEGLKLNTGNHPACARLVLASVSPRRLELLKGLGLNFDVVPSGIDEDMAGDVSPDDLVIALASLKARHVADMIKGGREQVEQKISDGGTGLKCRSGNSTFVLGADTIVVLDHAVLGKPQSRQDACRMLAGLSGRSHLVYTGVALLELPADRFRTGFAVSRVYFRPMAEAEIEAYVDTGEPLDKAGAYGLQGTGAAFVDKIDGCFSNVIGLPTPLVVELLRASGVTVLGLP